MDHDRCSELLAPFVRGELEAALASDVEAHLLICPDCSQEHKGLQALGQGEVPSLTELERARLRRVVLSEAVPMPNESAPVVTTAPGDARRARLFQLLGTAAVLALIGGFAYLGLSGGMGGRDGGDAADTATGGSELEASEEAFQDSDAPQKRGKASGTAGGASGSADTTMEARPPAPSPTFRSDLGPVDEKYLNKLGRSGLPLVIFSRAYSTDDVAERQASFIEELAGQAPTARGNDIRTCAAEITGQFPNSLLAYAALAEFEDRGDILVLAFAWTDEDTGPLAQSMVWAWSIGDCDGIPVHYSKNVIRPQR